MKSTHKPLRIAARHSCLTTEREVETVSTGHNKVISCIYLSTHHQTHSIFDLSTTQYTSNWNNITLDTNVGFSACFASSQSFLYILGGYLGATVMWSKVVQIVSLTTYEWIDNPPYIQHSRGNLACIVYNDYLWAFGGQNTGGSLASNERINIL
eukprot:467092_1